MGAPIRFTVPGRPQPKQRPRLGLRGRRAYTYTPAETVAYEQLVGWMARSQAGSALPLDGPLAVRLAVFSNSRRHRADIDNICKSVLDGLTGVAYADDSQVHRLEAELFTGADRVEVEIMPYEVAAI